MRVKSKRVEQLVKLLRNPDAQYVSIVDHGANQTPFSSLKLNSNSGVGNMIKKKLKKVSSSQISTSKAATAIGIRKLSFSGDMFKDSKIVNKWLIDHEWADYEVRKVDGGFEAATKDVVDKDFLNIRNLAVEDGVIAFVGEPIVADKATSGNQETGSVSGSEEESGSEDPTEPGSKSESSTKFDFWGAYLSGSDSVADVIKDGMKDGVPPGFDEIVFATTQAMANAMKADDADLQAKLTKAGEDMATIVFGIHSAFKSLVDTGENADTQKAVKEFKDSWDKSVEEAAASKTCKFIWGLGSDELSPEDSQDISLQTSAPADGGKDLQDINHILASFEEKISKSITSITEKVDSVSSEVKSANARVEEAEKQLEEQLSRAPAKKGSSYEGLDVTDDAESVEAQAQLDFDATMKRHAMGL